MILDKIIEATEKIADNYFLLPVAYRPTPIRRERIYCYELYHQLRKLIDNLDLTLSAEPDKHGHASFEGKQPNPDFILHTPGVHENNNTVIEVECRLQYKHLLKDFKNLKIMKPLGYQNLVLLLFSVNEVPWERLKRASIAAEIDLGEISILLHRSAGQAATYECLPDTLSTHVV